MITRLRLTTALVLACAVAPSVAAAPTAAQTLLQRTPNMSGGWTGAAGAAHFNFLHRFNQQGAPERRVLNRPTFLLAAGVAPRLLVGVHYATRSDIVARVPNEWEAFARYLAVRSSTNLPVDMTVQAGYNEAARSIDGEFGVTTSLGRVRLLGAARVLSAAYGEDTRTAAAAGATVRLTRMIALAGDVGRVLGADAPRAAWGVGIHATVPQSPHTFSLQATNTNSATLQGASRGADEVRWGFEFTVPITIARYFGGSTAEASGDGAAMIADAGVAADSVVAAIRDMAYAPERIEIVVGTAVIWQNDDEVAHTVTADDNSFDSGLLAPRASWRRVFDTVGEFPFYCGPHPFMRGVVVVRAR